MLAAVGEAEAEVGQLLAANDAANDAMSRYFRWRAMI
jgi:hypothetical protein